VDQLKSSKVSGSKYFRGTVYWVLGTENRVLSVQYLDVKVLCTA